MSAQPQPTQHSLTASPETVHWGYFDAKLKPHLTIDSGETVTLHCVSGGPGEVGHRTDLMPEHRAILDKVKPYLGPHILTGPVAVRGAKRGDTLEVRIKDVECAPTGPTTASSLCAARCPKISRCCASCRSRWTART